MVSETRPGTERGADGKRRCWWSTGTEDYAAYHDDEWGRPVVDDVRLYEKLCLEGFQSGLSWLTILRKRDGFRRAFAGFDPATVARFDDTDVERLLGDAGIVRHRGKIEAVINNARRAQELAKREGSLAAARALFARAAELAPRDPHAHAGLARALVSEGALEEAELAARRAVALRPRRAPYRVLLGDVLAAGGQHMAARAAWREALALDPDDTAIRARLGR